METLIPQVELSSYSLPTCCQLYICLQPNLSSYHFLDVSLLIQSVISFSKTDSSEPIFTYFVTSFSEEFHYYYYYLGGGYPMHQQNSLKYYELLDCLKSQSKSAKNKVQHNSFNFVPETQWSYLKNKCFLNSVQLLTLLPLGKDVTFMDFTNGF